MADADTSPNYNVAIVEAVLLEIAAELHPEHLSTGSGPQGFEFRSLGDVSAE